MVNLQILKTNFKAGQVQESSDAAQGAEAEEASPDEEEAAAGDGGDHEQYRAVIPQSETTKFKCQNLEIIFHYIFFSSCNRIKNIILSLDLTLYHSSCMIVTTWIRILSGLRVVAWWRLRMANAWDFCASRIDIQINSTFFC